MPNPFETGPVVAARYAEWGTRAGAGLIDGGIVLVGVFMIFGLIGRPAPILFVFFFLLAGVAYKPLMEGSRGQTLGKMAVGIKVVRGADGASIGYPEAFLRWFVGVIIGVVPFGSIIDVLWPLWDPHKQTLHDKAAKTIVVKA